MWTNEEGLLNEEEGGEAIRQTVKEMMDKMVKGKDKVDRVTERVKALMAEEKVTFVDSLCVGLYLIANFVAASPTPEFSSKIVSIFLRATLLAGEITGKAGGYGSVAGREGNA